MKKVLLALGVSLASLAVFAAVKTTFYGPIDMQNNKVINVADPTANKDATNKQYVDTGLSEKLDKSGDIMSGDLNMGGHKVMAMIAPTQEYDAANKGYVDGATNAAKYACNTNMYAEVHQRLNKAGGALTGTLDMQNHYIVGVKTPRTGVNGFQDATPRQYVDGATNAIKTYVRLNYLPLIGGTMTGNITMSNSSTIKGLPIAPDTDDTATSQGLTKYYWNDAKQVAKDYYSSATNYASGKLPLSGGNMYGDISMGGHRITAMNDPQNDFDGANKRYVDRAVNEGSSYQYFALKKGSGFTPFYELESNTNRFFEVVICKDFTGAITSYYENIATTNSAIYSNVARHWNVGEKIRIPFRMAQYTYSATNGTLIVKSGNGVVGNFGITAPPNAAIQYPIVAVIDGDEYNPDTAVNISVAWDGGSYTAIMKIKNNSGATIPRLYVNFGKATAYATSTEYTASASVEGFSPQTVPYTQTVGNLANGAEKTIMLTVLPFDELYGLRWSFEIIIGYTSFQFGQFFIPNAQ